MVKKVLSTYEVDLKQVLSTYKIEMCQKERSVWLYLELMSLSHNASLRVLYTYKQTQKLTRFIKHFTSKSTSQFLRLSRSLIY